MTFPDDWLYLKIHFNHFTFIKPKVYGHFNIADVIHFKKYKVSKCGL